MSIAAGIGIFTGLILIIYLIIALLFPEKIL